MSAASLSSPIHWAEPLARCVTAMAEHEWPQHWSELGEKLRVMAIQSELNFDLSSLVFQLFIIYIFL